MQETHIVAKDVLHQLDGVLRNDLVEDNLHLLTRGRLQLLLDETRPVLITAELDNIPKDVLGEVEDISMRCTTSKVGNCNLPSAPISVTCSPGTRPAEHSAWPHPLHGVHDDHRARTHAQAGLPFEEGSLHRGARGGAEDCNRQHHHRADGAAGATSAR